MFSFSYCAKFDIFIYHGNYCFLSRLYVRVCVCERMYMCVCEPVQTKININMYCQEVYCLSFYFWKGMQTDNNMNLFFFCSAYKLGKVILLEFAKNLLQIFLTMFNSNPFSTIYASCTIYVHKIIVQKPLIYIYIYIQTV